MIETKELLLREGADRINLRLPSKHIYGILGPKGAGKSTLLSLLSGHLCPEAGNVRINGFDTQKDAIKAKRCVGYLPQGLPLYGQMTPSELLLFSAQAKALPYERTLRQMREAFEITGLNDVENRQIKNLSQFEKVKLGVIQTSVGNTDTLLLDEIQTGLSEEETEELCDLLRYLGETHTVFVSSESAPFLLSLCDRILVLSDGALVADITPSEFSEEQYETLCESSRATLKELRKKHKRQSPETDGEYELIEEEKEDRHR